MSIGLPIGTMLGDYRIEEMIGRGGMGVVYRARQIELDRSVAIKVLAPELANDPSYRARFQREARLAAGLEHPNVVPVHGTGEVLDEGLMYLVMRYVPGTDLRALIRKHGGLAPMHAASIVAQVARALDAAHRQGLVHRDVKPANILVTSNDAEHVYLTDFGLTKALSSEAVMTRTGMWVGTVDYIAPEQLRGGDVDGRADVYSLGCVLYEALTGEVPYPRDSEPAKMWAHISDPPPSPRVLAPDVSEELDAVVRKAAAKEPEDRFQTAGELATAALHAARVHESAVQAASGAGPTASETVIRPTGSDPPLPTSPGAREPVASPASAPPTALSPAGASAGVVPPAAPTAAADHGAPARETAPPAERRPERQGRRRGPLLAAGALGAVAAVVAAVLLAGGGGGGKAAAGKVLPAIPVGAQPRDVTEGAGSMWVANEADSTLTRVAAATGKPAGGPVKVLSSPYRVAAGAGALWVISASDDEAAGIDPAEAAPKPLTAALTAAPYAVAVGEGAVWIAANTAGVSAAGRLIALDPATGARRASVAMGASLADVATGHGAVWVLDSDGGMLDRVRPDGPAVQKRIPVGPGTSAVVTDGAAVWVAAGGAGRLLRVDPQTDKVVKRIRLQRAAGEVALASGDGTVWWIDKSAGTVTRIDPRTNRTVGSPLKIGPQAGGAAVTPGTLWVTSPARNALIRVRF